MTSYTCDSCSEVEFRSTLPKESMASKEDFQQLKKAVQELRKGQLDILIRLEVFQKAYLRADCRSTCTFPVFTRNWRIA